MMEITRGLSYDDVLLIPQLSGLESRSEANIRTRLSGVCYLDLPIISAPMDTVTEENMATFMWESGGIGVIHRYNKVNKQYAMVKWVKDMGCRVGAAVGINGDSKDRVGALVEADVDFIVIDIAHGHSTKALEMVRYIKSLSKIPVMSGNIVTAQAAIDYVMAGADILRVGVGPGSACSTRLVAGVGFPQLSAISEVCNAVEGIWEGISVIADGGIKNSGDIVKALAAGASGVMIGGMLSPFSVAAGKRYSVKVSDESPLQEVFGVSRALKPGGVVNYLDVEPDSKIERYVTMKDFRGMASEEALKTRKSSFVVEGESFLVEERYDHKEFISALRDGIQMGFAYLGARNIEELQLSARFVEVSHAGYSEGTPHFEKGVKR